MTISVEQILAGTSVGRRQSVGQMDVIPILGDDDNTYTPPTVRVGTSNYGTVNLRNDSDNPTIVPPGAGWVVKQAAQDHAIGSGVIMPGKSKIKIDTAMCIQQSQGGTIKDEVHEMLILPAALRTEALAKRFEKDYARLWGEIGRFNADYGISGRSSHLEYFLKQYKKELDEFVAEFEIVPNQVGAIVLINGTVIGIERAPSTTFWEVLWEPLIRVCYGSLALKVMKSVGDTPSPTRIPLNFSNVTVKSLDQLEKMLDVSVENHNKLTEEATKTIRKMLLDRRDNAEMEVEGNQLFTAANDTYAGQYVTKDNRVRYASLCTGNI